VGPEQEVIYFMDAQRDLLPVVSDEVQSLAEAPKEMSREGDHVGCVIQPAYHGMKFPKSDGPFLDGIADVRCPCDELVEW
jgi:hypothetical protein